MYRTYAACQARGHTILISRVLANEGFAGLDRQEYEDGEPITRSGCIENLVVDFTSGIVGQTGGFNSIFLMVALP